MKPGFTITNRKLHQPSVIVVTNYEADNEVQNWPFVEFDKKEVTRSDVGMWKIKYKSHAKAA